MGLNIPQVSIVFPVRNEGTNVKMTLDSLFKVKTNIDFEVIIVNDGSEDNCCEFIKSYPYKKHISLINTKNAGPSNARNLGASKSIYPYIAFCDAHMTFEDFWMDKLIFHLEANHTDAICPAIGSLEHTNFIGYGQSLSPNLKIKWNPRKRSLFETAILPGAAILLPKKVFDDIGGFEEGFISWGHEDVELSIKLWLFGYRCHCEPSVKLLHLFRKTHPYKVEYEGVYYNLLTMAYLHFDESRISKTKKLIIHSPPSKIEKRVLNDLSYKKRKKYVDKRKIQAEEFFRKFNINF
jgi:glycosyltransferase involved in cell wall biosynthesis